MLNVKRMLEERGVPDALVMNSGKRVKTVNDFEKRRKEIKNILEEEEYGIIPPRPNHFRADEESITESFCAGKAPLQRFKLTCTIDNKKFTFFVSCVIPKSDKPLPAFVHISFSSSVPDIYMPSEEIADRGYAVFSFCFNDVTEDNGNFNDKAGKYLSTGAERTARQKLQSGLGRL